MRCSSLRALLSFLGIFVLPLLLHAQAPRSANLTLTEAQPALAFSGDAPNALKNLSGEALARAWPEWLASHDADIRARLERGEEDSLANLLMFGTSFTRQPRITPEFMASLESERETEASGNSPGLQQLIRVFNARADDLVSALSAPGSNERLEQMRHLVGKLGYAPDTPAGRAGLRKYLIADLARVRQESAAYAQRFHAAHQDANATEGFQQRSTMFQDRGISLDTSLLPNFALEQTLKRMRDQGLVARRSVQRVAIIGPGLDFVDKDEGYDFYPPQTIQPFALFGSLQQTGLASSTLQLTTLDISSRVNEHLASARKRAREGRAYTVQLPRDPSRNWLPAAVAYWEHFGDAIGKPAKPLPVPPTVQGLVIRAVRVRPEVVGRITALDLDVIASHLQLPAAKQFDLIIATNVFVYYSAFEQELALLNIAKMLRPGGFFLCNDLLPDIPGSGMTRAGDIAVPYSTKPGDGDRIVWYQRDRRD